MPVPFLLQTSAQRALSKEWAEEKEQMKNNFGGSYHGPRRGRQRGTTVGCRVRVTLWKTESPKATDCLLGHTVTPVSQPLGQYLVFSGAAATPALPPPPPCPALENRKCLRSHALGLGLRALVFTERDDGFQNPGVCRTRSFDCLVREMAFVGSQRRAVMVMKKRYPLYSASAAPASPSHEPVPGTLFLEGLLPPSVVNFSVLNKPQS